MLRHHSHGTLLEFDEAPSPRPSAAGCYTFLCSASRRSGYRRLDSEGGSGAAAVRVEVGTKKARSVFHVDPAVLEAEPVRRLLAAAGRRIAGGAVAVAVDAMLFEHLLWLAAHEGPEGGSDADLSEIVEFYSQEDDDCHGL